ncbi:hypothetical protein ACMWD3_04945 [Gardnerella swidsinskii]|uniref:hypothetical protein n=1 Tax=Gardnerella swidsinskii TaxID=2792979 RepID=UPI0039FCA8BE
MSNIMTTDEALKAFVETCDTPGKTLGEMTNAFKELEATIPHPLQCNSEFCYATLSKKIRMFADYMRVERAKVFVKFINLKRDETAKRAETLQEIKETCKTYQIALTLEASVNPNEK